MTAASPMPLGVTAVMLPDLDFDEQIALCQRLGVTHYSLRPRIIPDDMRDKPWSNWGNHRFDLTPQRLLEEATAIRQRLDAAGIVPFGTVPSANTLQDDASLQLDLQGAAAVGAGRMRLNPAPYPKGPFDYKAFLDGIVERYRQILPMARACGIKLVIETHCRSLAASPALAWNIVRHFDPAEIGLIFDLPNFAIEGNLQPNLAVAVVRDYIDHLHIGGTRRTDRGPDAIGFRQVGNAMCGVHESDLHVPSYLAALKEAGVEVPLMIEDYASGATSSERLEQNVQALRRALSALYES